MRRHWFMRVIAIASLFAVVGCGDAKGDDPSVERDAGAEGDAESQSTDCGDYSSRTTCQENDCVWILPPRCGSQTGSGYCDDQPHLAHTPDCNPDTNYARPDADTMGTNTDAGDTSGSDGDAVACGEGETLADDACVQCGADGGCAERAPRCVVECEMDADCDDDPRDVPLTCADGVCQQACI